MQGPKNSCAGVVTLSCTRIPNMLVGLSQACFGAAPQPVSRGGLLDVSTIVNMAPIQIPFGTSAGPLFSMRIRITPYLLESTSTGEYLGASFTAFGSGKSFGVTGAFVVACPGTRRAGLTVVFVAGFGVG